MERVTFPNRGNTVVGNLFTPPGPGAGSKYPAIVVTHPFGAVKEQVSTLYAEKLTEQGFITLVFDASYQGESGGEPHFTEIPAARVEDIRCAVDFLSNHPQADEDRIGALGICAGGGYTINAAQTELRIKAVAGVSTFDIGSARREGVGGMIPLEARMRTLEEVGRQRTREARGEPVGYFSLVPDDPQQALNNPSQLYREGYVYYVHLGKVPGSGQAGRTGRGHQETGAEQRARRGVTRWPRVVPGLARIPRNGSHCAEPLSERWPAGTLHCPRCAPCCRG